MRNLVGPSLQPASGGAARQLVVLLHGYGSNGADMIALAPLWQRALPDALFVAPDGIERCVGSAGGYQWWGLTSFDPAALAAGARRAAPSLDGYLDALLDEHGLTPDRLLLVGFSQGTMLALEVGLSRPDALAGIIGYSGMIARAPLDAAHVRSRPPVLLVHGGLDPVVPVHGTHGAAAELRRHGIGVDSFISPRLGHSVDAAGLQAGERFAQRVLARARDRAGVS